MNDCLILGSGRSGTSMMGGIVHDAGYFMGDDLYPARHSNPKGFFECPDINGINERILRRYSRPSSDDQHTIYSPGIGQFWLLSMKEHIFDEYAEPEIEKHIMKMVAMSPFAYKDPRFGYTLPIWQRYLPDDTRFIVMFRNPDATVTSILKECADMPYLSSLQIDPRQAQESWMSLYRSILKCRRKNPDNFVFIHYDQVLNGDAAGKLSDFLGVKLAFSFVDRNLNRSDCNIKIEYEVMELYAELCALAEMSTTDEKHV